RRPLPMLAHRLLELLPELCLSSAGHTRMERGQSQRPVESVSGHQQQTDRAAERLRRPPGGIEGLLIMAKEEADDLSQDVKTPVGVSRGPIRLPANRLLEARGLGARRAQALDEVLPEAERVAVEGSLADDLRVFAVELQDVGEPIPLLE